MEKCPRAVVERATKIQRVILRAMAKKTTWFQAAEIAGLSEVIEREGLFFALYSDRGSHFWLTPTARGKVDRRRLPQAGRALRDPGVQMIPAYSPQARGRSERNFTTWQGRLPQELRLRGIGTVADANRFLRTQYITEFNVRFQVSTAQNRSAFRPRRRRDLSLVFSLQFERTVNRDNADSFQNLTLQIERVSWRGTLAGCNVKVHQHPDGALSIACGLQRLGCHSREGAPLGKLPPWKRLLERRSNNFGGGYMN